MPPRRDVVYRDRDPYYNRRVDTPTRTIKRTTYVDDPVDRTLTRRVVDTNPTTTVKRTTYVDDPVDRTVTRRVVDPVVDRGGVTVSI